MGFLSGSVSYRRFQVDGGNAPTADKAVEALKALCARSLEHINEEKFTGWTAPTHLLDNDIVAEKVCFGDYLFAILRTDKKQVPAALLKAMVAQEEQVRLKGEGKKKLSGKDRKELKEEVALKLLKNTPPSLSGVEMVYDLRDNQAYLGSHSLSAIDAFVETFVGTFELSPILIEPPLVAEQKGLSKSKIKMMGDIKAARFTGSIGDAETQGDEVLMEENFLGKDFLTWLWYELEKHEGNFELPEIGKIGLMLDDQMSLVSELTASKQNILKKGSPSTSAEAVAGLKAGKKLSRAKFYLGIGEEQFLFTIDARNLDISGLNLPKFKAENPVEYFEERMKRLKLVSSVVDEFFHRFIVQRLGEDWNTLLEEIRGWIGKKKGR